FHRPFLHASLERFGQPADFLLGRFAFGNIEGEANSFIGNTIEASTPEQHWKPRAVFPYVFLLEWSAHTGALDFQQSRLVQRCVLWRRDFHPLEFAPLQLLPGITTIRRKISLASRIRPSLCQKRIPTIPESTTRRRRDSLAASSASI